MKITAIFVLVLATSWAYPDRPAERCTNTICTIADDCRCASTRSPLEEGDTAPQLVVLTFSDPIQNTTYYQYLDPLLSGRVNPDGQPISATFYISHEFTDYARVHDLYIKGHEIGVNSISNNNIQDYWRNADLDTLKQEFGGQKTIMNNFGKIPTDHIIGARTPQLQINGDISIQAYIESDLQYDNSWPSRSTTLLFPYTLDYASTQECSAGHPCPQESHPHFWIAPILNLQGANGTIECNFLSSCLEEGTAEHIRDWLLAQVDRVRTSNRAPLSILVVPAWFTIAENHWTGFNLFLDALAQQQDVFLVSQKQALDWTKNPVALAEFRTETEERTPNCPQPINCNLEKPDGTVRYMVSCVPCPKNYPWLGDPYGNGGETPPPTTPPPTTPPTTPPVSTTTTEATETTTASA